MERNRFGVENVGRSFTSSSERDEFESLLTKENNLSEEKNTSFLSSFSIELIQRIQHVLGSVKNFTQLSRGKFSDREFGEYYYRAVTEDIEKIDIVLNSLINYIKIHTPIRKTNTVHNIIEGVLKKHQAKLGEKGIKLLKKFEKDLPETIVPDEQLKYILNSILQYAMASTPPNWNIGLSTRSVILEKEVGEVQSLFKREGKYIEISIVFPSYKKPSESTSETEALQKEEASDLLLRFVKEVVLQNRGTMRIGADEKRTKTFISLRFPAERRKVVYYQPVN